MRIRLIPLSLWSVALCCGLRAQVLDDHVVVVTRTPAPAQTTLLDVDLRTGVILPLGRFALDTMPPLAVAVDDVNRDVVVALQPPANVSALVRLRIAGTAVVQQTPLGDVPGTVSALAQALGGSWIATTAAGVYVTERNGGVARLLVALPRVSAIETFGHGSHQAVVAQSGNASADPAVRWLDLDNGQTLAGPWVYAGHMPRGFTGVADLPTGLSRQVVGQDDGTVAVSVNFANPVPLPLAPALPPGATVAVRVRGLDGLALGNSAHPFLKTFAALNGTQWNMVAGPLAGDPIDFAFRPPAVAATVTFAAPCTAMMLREDPAGGSPRLGNANYGLRLERGAPSAPAFLLLGASDQRYLALRLPAVLPGGCALLASADVLLATTTDGFGAGSIRIGVPSSTALAGGIVFAQWLQVRGAGIDGSDGGAIWLGR